MIVLGLDTATPATVVGLRLADGRTLQARDDPAARRRPGHATQLLPLADGVLAEAGTDWAELKRIAVGVGPGTFTGLRIGIATARGLAQSLGVELVGVSSLRALAHGAGEDAQRVLAVIDARRGEVFLAAYDGGQELIAPQAVSPDAVAELVETVAIDTQLEDWLALGDGAMLYREAFERAGVRVAEDRCEHHQIQAHAICELGEQALVSTEMVVPDYRRRPDAEIALEGAQA
ncbi:MAG TPA: tRNA (adenosine(37)-N6)-threonylcarbamoyltransferase complex dimerization subunit type 1 TsaB [Solirubrobacteraceae bacterium]|nr:tRNA (adenosine(37)-N6)-threonylcarbamoyltransferase complex dimerization subunit type 1 TsaB [Solirubrobacteraceae bacterium]